MKRPNHEEHEIDLQTLQDHEDDQMGFVFFVVLRRFLAIFAVFVVSGGVAAAHHGVRSFDTMKTVTLRGTVAKIEWINPHVVLTLDVRKDNGSAEQWFIALSPPSVMIRKGIKRDAIKEGATMSVTGYVAATAMLVKVTAIEFTMPDGRSFATGNAAFNPIDTSSPRQLPVQKK